jgi:hypothetical protein
MKSNAAKSLDVNVKKPYEKEAKITEKGIVTKWNTCAGHRPILYPEFLQAEEYMQSLLLDDSDRQIFFRLHHNTPQLEIHGDMYIPKPERAIDCGEAQICFQIGNHNGLGNLIPSKHVKELVKKQLRQVKLQKPDTIFWVNRTLLRIQMH